MTTVERTILPPSSTALERAVDISAPQWAALLGTSSSGPIGLPAVFAPWLAAEWGLDGFSAYFANDPRALIDAGLPWLRTRGTPAAVRRALAWLGYTHVKIEEDGTWLHLDLGRRIEPQDLLAVAHVVRASIPAHVAFYRVFHGLDGRPIRLDNGPALDVGWLDSDTGAPIEVDPWGDPVKLSQGLVITRTTRAPAHHRAHAMGWARHTRIARRRDELRLDCWRLDSPTQPPPRRCTFVPRTHGAPVRVSPAPLRLTAGQLCTHASAPALSAPRRAAALHHLRSCPPAHNPDRGWTGTWDEQPWRVSIAHSITQEP